MTEARAGGTNTAMTIEKASPPRGDNEPVEFVLLPEQPADQDEAEV